MSTIVFRLIAPRPTFAQDMTDEEREIMGRHAAHWRPYLDSGQMVFFGPVLDETGSYGLGVVEIDDEDEEELRAFAARDPVVTTGTAEMVVGKMLQGFVRPRA
jgi:uncharacterized protein YciI